MQFENENDVTPSVTKTSFTSFSKPSEDKSVMELAQES